MMLRGSVASLMSPWDDHYVGELVDELERCGRISSSVAERARTAVAEGRHRDALDLVLGPKEDVEPSGRVNHPSSDSMATED